MDPALGSLIAASAALVVTHFTLSHPLRPVLAKGLGEGGFLGLYSLVAAACMVWMYYAFTAIPVQQTPLWPGFDDVSWAIGSLLTLVALVLFTGSLTGNPALPAPGAAEAAEREPAGVFRVTRHPMMWGFAFWAIAHILAAPTARTLTVSTAILVLALVGAYLQDRKKARLMGNSWRTWQGTTTFWPRLAELPRAGFTVWIIATALWLALTYAHLHAGDWAAGIWRWVP